MSMIDQGSSRTMSAMFDNRADADRAVSALRAEGIADVVLTGEDNPGYMASDSLAGGARTEDRGFFEALGDFFFPDEDRYTYAEGLNRGGFLVTVRNVPADKVDRALDILDDEGAVDLDARESEWRASGWSNDMAGRSGSAGYGDTYGGAPDGMATPPVGGAVPPVEAGVMTGAVAPGPRDASMDTLPGGRAPADRPYGEAADRDGVIEVAEEQVRIGKRERDLGRVRVRSYVREIPVEEQVNLREERVTIERRPVDRPATDADFQDQSIEAREYAEEAVVSKEARVVEEIAVGSEVESHEEVVRDTVRKTEVEVDDERDTLPGGDVPPRPGNGRV